jgi:hypothetical protein
MDAAHGQKRRGSDRCRVETDADDADLEGKRMETSANHGEWREFTAKRPLIAPDREVMTANGKKSAS